MREKTYHLYLNEEERSRVIQSLIELKNNLAAQLLGKETIDTNTFGKSTGRSGNYSTNYQISGRELRNGAYACII